MINPFESGFTLTQLTRAINKLPNMYGRVNELGMFRWQPQTTNTVTIEMREGTLRLVPTTPWGGVAPKPAPTKRNIRSFQIPHTPIEDTVMASDIMGIRAFGTENVGETIAGRVNDKMQTMRNYIDQTMEWRKVGALKGLVLDADGTTVIENYFTAFGVTKKVIDFALDDPNTDVRAKCVEVLRWIEDHLQGEVSTGVQALTSAEFYDALISHPKVERLYIGYAEGARLLGGDPRKGFNFGGIAFEEYRGIVDGHRFIDAGKGNAFPTGTQETYANFGAPADFNETVNTLAIPLYARQKNKDFNRGIDLHVQANQLPMLLRPETSVEITA
jgi:hypothetical protein